VGFLSVFVAAGKLAWRGEHAISDEVLLIRGLAVCALVLLHVILCIGPAARLSPRFAPLLYNRRHLGVTMFMVALAHATLATFYYGGFGGRNPLGAVLDSGSFRSISGFPFEWLGLLALLILFVMAATSHDFWLNNLSAKVWKRLHMGVYVAYAAVLLHVALGAMQSEAGVLARVLLLLGAVLVAALHTAAGLRERRRDAREHVVGAEDEWIDAAGVREIPESRAKIVRVRGCRPIALFRHEGGFNAVSNVCAHQGGPLGEGKIVGGCITCPWHGFQYLPRNGQSPPPFTEKIATYEVRVRGDRVEVRAKELPPGTDVEPARVHDGTQDGGKP
jgi:nitrite reductase/ring-hydroxylating ferredoxin subunit/DMSO/TMAO reductase YedYZ heme-binding membrane subunit